MANIIDLRKSGHEAIIFTQEILIDTKLSKELKLTIVTPMAKLEVKFNTLEEMNEFVGQMAGHNKTF